MSEAGDELEELVTTLQGQLERCPEFLSSQEGQGDDAAPDSKLDSESAREIAGILQGLDLGGLLAAQAALSKADALAVPAAPAPAEAGNLACQRNSYLRELTCRVISCEEISDQRELVLDDTVLFPEVCINK